MVDALELRARQLAQQAQRHLATTRRLSPDGDCTTPEDFLHYCRTAIWEADHFGGRPERRLHALLFGKGSSYHDARQRARARLAPPLRWDLWEPYAMPVDESRFERLMSDLRARLSTSDYGLLEQVHRYDRRLCELAEEVRHLPRFADVRRTQAMLTKRYRRALQRAAQYVEALAA